MTEPNVDHLKQFGERFSKGTIISYEFWKKIFQQRDFCGKPLNHFRIKSSIMVVTDACI